MPLIFSLVEIWISVETTKEEVMKHSDLSCTVAIIFVELSAAQLTINGHNVLTCTHVNPTSVHYLAFVQFSLSKPYHRSCSWLESSIADCFLCFKIHLMSMCGEKIIIMRLPNMQTISIIIIIIIFHLYHQLTLWLEKILVQILLTYQNKLENGENLQAVTSFLIVENNLRSWGGLWVIKGKQLP